MARHFESCRGPPDRSVAAPDAVPLPGLIGTPVRRWGPIRDGPGGRTGPARVPAHATERALARSGSTSSAASGSESTTIFEAGGTLSSPCNYVSGCVGRFTSELPVRRVFEPAHDRRLAASIGGDAPLAASSPGRRHPWRVRRRVPAR